jgi:hypothetical protein
MKLKKKEYKKYLFEYHKMEIDMYWKRSTFYWTIIGAIFAGYFLISGSINDNTRLKLLVESLGVIVSLSWYLVFRGSKFWDIHWINKIQEIKNNNLLDIVKEEKQSYGKIFNLFRPFPFAITKINLILSFFILLVWVVLMIETNIENYRFSLKHMNIYAILINALTASTFVMLIVFSIRKENIRRSNKEKS